MAGDTKVGAAGAGGFTVSVANLVVPPLKPEMLTVVGVVTGLVVTVKVAVVAPAATVTLVGTVAAAESSERDTAAPPAGAAALKVTVPVEEVPPTTLVGLTDSAESVGPGGDGGLTVIEANWNTLSRAAES